MVILIRILFLLALASPRAFALDWEFSLQGGCLFPLTGVFVDTEKAFDSQAEALLFPGFKESYRSHHSASSGPSFQGRVGLGLPLRFWADVWGGYAEVRRPSEYSFEQEGVVGSAPFDSDVWVRDEDRIDVFAARFLGPRLGWASGLGPLGLDLAVAAGWAHVRMSESYRNEATASGFANGDLESAWISNVRGMGWTLDVGAGFSWPRRGRWKARLGLGFQTMTVSRLRGAWSTDALGTGAFQSFTGSEQGDAVWTKLTDTDTGQVGYGIGQSNSLGTVDNLVTEEAPFFAAGLRLDLGVESRF